MPRPGQPVGASIQAGGQNHRLTDAAAGRAQKEVVEEAGAHRDRIHQQLHVAVGTFGALAVNQAGEEVEADGAHQCCRERVADDRIVVLGGRRTAGGDHRCGGTDARCKIPTIPVCPC